MFKTVHGVVKPGAFPQDTGVKTVVVHDAPGWSALEPHWNALLEKAAPFTVFQTPEWIYPWWRRFGVLGGGEPRAVATYESDALVGLLPFYLSGDRTEAQDPPRGRLRWMGTTRVCSDHLDGLLDPAHRDAVHAEWRTAFTQLAVECDAVDLADTAEDAEFLKCGAEFPEGFSEESRPADVCPYIELPDDFETYRTSRVKKLKKEIGVKRRRLAKLGAVELSTIERPEQVADGFEAFVELHQRRRESMDEVGSFSDPDYLAFHREAAPALAAKGRLLLNLLLLDGRPVAAQHGFVSCGRVQHYLPGHDPGLHKQSVGMVLTSYCIEQAIERSYREIDLLRGDEPYKSLWADASRGLVRWRGERRYSPAWVARKRENAVRSAKDVVKTLLRR